MGRAFGPHNIAAAKKHYLANGWKEKRNCACSSIPIAQCNWQCYLNRYKDLQRAFGPHNIAAAKKHYLTYGRKEKRNCACSSNPKGNAMRCSGTITSQRYTMIFGRGFALKGKKME